MAKKNKDLLQPAVDVCRNLLEQSFDNDNVDDFSIRFTWDEPNKRLNLAVTNHTGEKDA